MEYKIQASRSIRFGLEPTDATVRDIEITGLAAEPVVIKDVLSAQRTRTNAGKDAVAVSYLVNGNVVTKLYGAPLAGLVDFLAEVE